MKLAFFGGVYNNYLALEAAINDAESRGAGRLYCLGDFGAFGPHPNRVFPIIQENNVICIQGNYDDSVGNDLSDCQCGYTDLRDNYFAQLSYDYTYRNTSLENRKWLRQLPKQIRFEAGGVRFLLCHGSPRKVNEFLWESTTSTHFLEKMVRENEADWVLGTHTGIHWERKLSEGKRFVNVGALGRPENDGTTNVWYTLVSTGEDSGVDVEQGGKESHQNVSVEFVPLEYDHERLANEMKEEKIPDEFVETILTGWWTTCLEVLPGKERKRGCF